MNVAASSDVKQNLEAPMDPRDLWSTPDQPSTAAAPVSGNEVVQSHGIRTGMMCFALPVLALVGVCVIGVAMYSDSSENVGDIAEPSQGSGMVFSSSYEADDAHAKENATSSNRTKVTVVYFGNGCFWERQYAYTNVEMDESGPFKRPSREVTSVVGYGGGRGQSSDGLVCYHHAGGNQDNTYGSLGHCEVVAVAVESGTEQYKALVEDYFSSFTQTAAGMQRPDPGDTGGEYRNVIGIPGGVDGTFYPLVQAANVHGMVLETGTGNEDDTFNHVYIMDSDEFPFYRGEQYHQFHSNFFGPDYSRSYLDDVRKTQLQLGIIPPTGCPEGKNWRN